MLKVTKKFPEGLALSFLGKNIPHPFLSLFCIANCIPATIGFGQLSRTDFACNVKSEQTMGKFGVVLNDFLQSECIFFNQVFSVKFQSWSMLFGLVKIPQCQWMNPNKHTKLLSSARYASYAAIVLAVAKHWKQPKTSGCSETSSNHYYSFGRKCIWY